MLMTTATSGPGSSGGPLLTPSGEVTGVITWQFAGEGGRQPRVMVAIRSEVLSLVLPALLSSGSWRPLRSGLEGRMGPAGLAAPSRSNALLGIQLTGARLLRPPGPAARSAGLRLWDEVLRVDGLEVQRPADVLDVSQQSAAALQRGMGVEPSWWQFGSTGPRPLAVSFRRPGDAPGVFRHADVWPAASPAPRQSTELLVRSAKVALRIYLASRFLRSTGRLAQDFKSESQALARGSAALLDIRNGSSGFNMSAAQALATAEKTLRFAAQFLLTPPSSVCTSFVPGKTCSGESAKPGAKQTASWTGIKGAPDCLRKCQQRHSEAKTSCCSYSPGGKTCKLFAATNGTDPFADGGGDSQAALCQSVEPSDEAITVPCLCCCC